MAITQAVLAEEILSRQERAVVRGIHRASCLADALNALDKTYVAYQSCGTGKSGDSSEIDKQHMLLKAYLAKAIQNALVSTKAPASAHVVKDIPSPT
jgi:hypothetical protein